MNLRVCPNCESDVGIRRILWGIPVFPVDESKNYIGGCLVAGNEPDYKCIVCNWEDYEILCDLIAGSDFEGDSAWYWEEKYVVGEVVLSQIAFQWSVDSKSWHDCVVITSSGGTAFFPGNNNVKAKAGFYLPPLSYHSGKFEQVEVRALVPATLVKHK